jgi:hypothetical protein
MEREADRFVAVLPKPRKGLKEFRYYIEASDPTFEAYQTPESDLKVVVDPALCRDNLVAKTVASAKVIIHVPAGYKVSPVPEGFSARGVFRAGEERLGVFPHMSLTAALVAAGLVGGGAAAVGLSQANLSPGPVVLSAGIPAQVTGKVTLLSSSPPPGATVSLSSGFLAFTLRVVVDHDVVPGSMTAEFHHFSTVYPKNLTCALISAFHSGFRAHTAQDVTISGRPFGEATCGSSFGTEAVIVSIESSQGNIASGDFPLNYTFVP